MFGLLEFLTVWLLSLSSNGKALVYVALFATFVLGGLVDWRARRLIARREGAANVNRFADSVIASGWMTKSLLCVLLAAAALWLIVIACEPVAWLSDRADAAYQASTDRYTDILFRRRYELPGRLPWFFAAPAAAWAIIAAWRVLRSSRQLRA